MNTKERIIGLIELYLRRGPAGRLLGVGAGLLSIPWLAGFITYEKKLDDGGTFALKINTADTSIYFDVVCYIVGVGLIGFALYLIVQQYRSELRKIIVALELRGLGTTIDTPLINAIPARYMGKREQILMDVRQLVQGTDEQRRQAVEMVNWLPTRIQQLKDGKDRCDLTVCAGGLAPVPLLFLAGNLLSSESQTHWFDWSRTTNAWVTPEAGVQLGPIEPVAAIGQSERIILACAISYPINTTELEQVFSGVPIVELKVTAPTPGLVANPAFTAELQMQFMRTIATFKAQGVREVGLVLAAPSAVSMQLGACYSARNMPALVVYQYQQAHANNPYPWAVRMPDSEDLRGKYETHLI